MEVDFPESTCPMTTKLMWSLSFLDIVVFNLYRIESIVEVYQHCDIF